MTTQVTPSAPALSGVSPVRRTVGLDAHPDLFTAAILVGADPATAQVTQLVDKRPLPTLEDWVGKHTEPEDTIVLEASGNSFEIVERLAKVPRRAIVLESCQAGQVGKSYCSNDKLSAVKLARAWLSGLCKVVWCPDPQTRQRREILHLHRKYVKDLTRTRNRLRSFLNEHRVRIPRGSSLTDQDTRTWILKQLDWPVLAQALIQRLWNDIQHAESQRRGLRQLIAQQVLEDPRLLQLTRLLGIRDVLAFAIGAIVGDITRFANPRKLVAYVGLNGRVQQSGNGQTTSGLPHHGRGDLRALLLQAAHCILRLPNHPLAHWGRRLFHRKSILNVAAVAVARKLLVSVWYLMQGRMTPLAEVDESLQQKISKMITQLGADGLEATGQDRRSYKAAIAQRLQDKSRVYVLDPSRTFTPGTPARV